MRFLGTVMAMKLNEFPPMVRDHGLFLAKPGAKRAADYSKPCGRVYNWAQTLRECGADAYGDWNIRDVSQGAACLGTVVATLHGPRGTVEAWNNRETFFIPKGVKPSKEPDYREIDAANGIVYRKADRCGLPTEDIAWACGLAGITSQERLAI